MCKPLQASCNSASTGATSPCIGDFFRQRNPILETQDWEYIKAYISANLQSASEVDLHKLHEGPAFTMLRDEGRPPRVFEIFGLTRKCTKISLRGLDVPRTTSAEVLHCGTRYFADVGCRRRLRPPPSLAGEHRPSPSSASCRRLGYHRCQHDVVRLSRRRHTRSVHVGRSAWAFGFDFRRYYCLGLWISGSVREK